MEVVGIGGDPRNRRAILYAIANMVVEMTPSDAYNFCVGVLGMSEYRYETLVVPIVTSDSSLDLSPVAKGLIDGTLNDVNLIKVPTARAVAWVKESGLTDEDIAEWFSENDPEEKASWLESIKDWVTDSGAVEAVAYTALWTVISIVTRGKVKKPAGK